MPRRHASTTPPSRPCPASPAWPKRTPIRRCPKTATGGRSCSASGCAGISGRTSASKRAWPATTTSTARTARTMPAAICRKVIQAKMTNDPRIVIWGDGSQTRSFTYITDCLEGTRRLMHSDVRVPLNVGSSEMVSINQLVDLVEQIAGVRLTRTYDTAAPKGVAGRNSDNTLVRQLLGWEPSTALITGLEATYRWIYDQLCVRV